MSLQIRRAIAADVPWLLEQLRAFAGFFGSKRSLFPADDTLAETIIAALIAEHPFLIGISDTQNVPVGFIAGALMPHPYNPALTVLTELFWWVAPEHRGSSAGARLLEAFIALGRAHAQLVVMTLEAKSPVDDRVLLKRGFLPFERSYLLEV